MINRSFHKSISVLDHFCQSLKSYNIQTITFGIRTPNFIVRIVGSGAPSLVIREEEFNKWYTELEAWHKKVFDGVVEVSGICVVCGCGPKQDV